MGGGDAVGDGPALARAEQDEAQVREVGLEGKHREDVRRPLDVHHQRLAALDDGDQSLGIGARIDVLAVALAAAVTTTAAGEALRLVECVPEQREGGGAAAAGVLRARLAQLDKLEGAATGENVRSVGEADQRPLPGEDIASGRGRDDGAGDAAGTGDGDLAVAPVQGWDDIERGGEGRLPRRGVVGLGNTLDFIEAKVAHADHEAGRDDLTAAVDHRRARRRRAGPDAPDTAAVDDDRRAFDRGAGTGHHRRVGNGDGRGMGRAGEQGKDQERLHLTSPAPGWPTSKSARGRRFGSAASYISAPSIQTSTGRE